MPRTRRNVADAIAAKFLPAKSLSVQASAATAECLAALMTGRFEARVQPGTGSEILELIHRSNQLSFEAAQCYDKAHALIAEIRREWSVPPHAYGAEDTPPPNLLELRSVA